jgi:DNA-binding winged helix-turn-helix (wHTH) protein
MCASVSNTTFGRLRRARSPALTESHLELGLDVRRPIQSSDTRKPMFEKRAEPAGAAPTQVSFGPFRLLPAQFLLLQGDKPVPLGSRALEILIVLLERPGELVSKQELMARVWPNIFVEPANLTVHISALRRMLRDGRDGNRFIINIPGRGYSFVASVEASASRRLEPATFEGALSLDALPTPIRFDGLRVSNRTRRHAAVIRPTVRSNQTAAPQDRSLSGGKARNRPFARS